MEKKVEEASSELEMYKKKCDELLKENSSLADQVRALRAMLERHQAAGAHHVGLKMEPADGKSDSFLAAVNRFPVVRIGFVTVDSGHIVAVICLNSNQQRKP